MKTVTVLEDTQELEDLLAPRGQATCVREVERESP